MIFMVVGARPNFIKMAPVILEARQRGMAQFLVHTGQHYDQQMSRIFFDELGMPMPDANLGVGSSSHADQTAHIMMAFEPLCLQHKPELVVVAGDVNSTLGCALTAAKLEIPVAHVESGLRSFDRSMPEEINRVLTDHIAELLFTSEESGNTNLQKEGIPSEYIHFVGNSMIDSLHSHLPRSLERKPWKVFNLQPGEYGVVTFHRPANVDHPEVARNLAQGLAEVGQHLPLIFPIHPRTLAQSGDVLRDLPGVHIVEPLGYLDFLGLMARARVVLTDSGGIQEETTALGVNCVTVRPNTERPVTLTQGTNQLVTTDPEAIAAAALNPPERPASVPEKWDGHAAVRIVDVIVNWQAGIIPGSPSSKQR